MPVLVRRGDEPFYKKAGGGAITYQEKETADRVDAYLSAEVPTIERRMRNRFPNARRYGSEYWYWFGKELERLWKKARKLFALPQTELFLFLEAAQYHASVHRFSEKTLLRHPIFRYSYELAKMPPEVASQERWRTWVEFFDSAIKNDPRIMSWLVKRSRQLKPESVRALLRRIRAKFKKTNSTVLSRKELYAELDKLL